MIYHPAVDRPIETETSGASTAEEPISWTTATTWPFTPLDGKMISTLLREHDRRQVFDIDPSVLQQLKYCIFRSRLRVSSSLKTAGLH